MSLLRRVKSVSLRTKIVVPVAVVLGFAFLCIAYAASQVLKQQFYESSRHTAVQKSQIAELSLRRAMLSGRSGDIVEEIKHMASDPSMSRIALRRPDDSYLVDAHSPDYEFVKHLVFPDSGESFIDEFQIEGQTFLRVTTAVANEPACYSCHAPANDPLGYLEVDTSIGWLEDRIQMSYNLIAFVAGGTLFFVWLAIALSMNAAVVNPLKRLARAMSGVKRGERGVRVTPGSEDEIGRLGHSFNDMIDEVARAEASLVETERQLAEAEKLAGIGLMAAGVAHEINNPLAAVSVAAETLNNSERLTEEQKARLSKLIYEGSERIQKIVAELLTLDRKQVLVVEPEDPVIVLRQALHSVDVPANIRVHFRVKEDLPKINVNRDKIARAIGNIIKNAVQAMPEGGELTILAQPENADMIVQIIDTGFGIEPDVLEHIFDPFFSTREVGKGFGLGLAFAHSTVVQHGGDITASSKVDEGTEFTVILPLAQEADKNA